LKIEKWKRGCFALYKRNYFRFYIVRLQISYFLKNTLGHVCTPTGKIKAKCNLISMVSVRQNTPRVWCEYSFVNSCTVKWMASFGQTFSRMNLSQVFKNFRPHYSIHSMYICMYVWMYVCTYVWMCVCTYVCVRFLFIYYACSITLE